MKKSYKKILLLIVTITFVIFSGYKCYQYKMQSVLFGIDKIALLKNGTKNINVEILINSQVKEIFKNASYAGKFIISEQDEYIGTCYFVDGIQGTVFISRKNGDISLLVSDDYERCFKFKNTWGNTWLEYIDSISNNQ